MSASALIFGSTGAAGRQVLQSLLSESSFARTYEVGRRKTEYPIHGVETPSKEALSRLNSVTVPTAAFEDPASLKAALPESNDWTSVFITLGTTRAVAGSAETFVKIDRDYVINAAKAAKLDMHQRVLYCSSMGADSGSYFPYMRSKGQTEEGLAALGYAETIIFRPGMLWPKGGREERRLVESVAGFFMKNVVAKVFANTEISTDILGQAMMVAGQVGIEGCLRHGVGEMVKLKPMGREVLLIKNDDALKLAKVTL